MNNLAIFKHNGQFVVDSRIVAEIVGKKHATLLRDIRVYISQMNEANNELEQNETLLIDYFIENSYKAGNGKKYPCYLITKIGCEFIANKLTGVKGTAFTAVYTKHFSKMIKRNHVELRMIATYHPDKERMKRTLRIALEWAFNHPSLPDAKKL